MIIIMNYNERNATEKGDNDKEHRKISRRPRFIITAPQAGERSRSRRPSSLTNQHDLAAYSPGVAGLRARSSKIPARST